MRALKQEFNIKILLCARYFEYILYNDQSPLDKFICMYFGVRFPIEQFVADGIDKLQKTFMHIHTYLYAKQVFKVFEDFLLPTDTQIICLSLNLHI